jgi:hypothetical protein
MGSHEHGFHAARVNMVTRVRLRLRSLPRQTRPTARHRGCQARSRLAVEAGVQAQCLSGGGPAAFRTRSRISSIPTDFGM